MNITREQALQIIKNHGWKASEQTACFNGETVKSGYSFNEMLGIKKEYSLKSVMLWLGY